MCKNIFIVLSQKEENMQQTTFYYFSFIIKWLFLSGLFFKEREKEIKKGKELGTHSEVPSHQRLSIVSWITCDGWDLWIRICIKRFTTHYISYDIFMSVSIKFQQNIYIIITGAWPTHFFHFTVAHPTPVTGFDEFLKEWASDQLK